MPGITTEGLILKSFIIGTKTLIKPSVKPHLSSILQIITLTITAIPTSLIRKVSTTTGKTFLTIMSNRSDKEWGAINNISTEAMTKIVPIISLGLHFFRD